MRLNESSTRYLLANVKLIRAASSAAGVALVRPGLDTDDEGFVFSVDDHRRRHLVHQKRAACHGRDGDAEATELERVRAKANRENFINTAIPLLRDEN